jgi:hypothetical protein
MKLPWHESEFRVKEGAKHICGRVLEHVVVTASQPGPRHHPLSHLYLVFGDGSHYEFYTNGDIGWEQPTWAQEGVIGRMLGKKLAAVLIGHIDIEGTSALRLVVEDGSACSFVATREIQTTTRIMGGGILDALGYGPDDVVLLHCRRRPRMPANA